MVEPKQFIELSDDILIENNDFKNSVAKPYFKDIYKDLSAQSEDKNKGISIVSFLNVSHLKDIFFSTANCQASSASACSKCLICPTRAQST